MDDETPFEQASDINHQPSANQPPEEDHGHGSYQHSLLNQHLASSYHPGPYSTPYPYLGQSYTHSFDRQPLYHPSYPYQGPWWYPAEQNSPQSVYPGYNTYQEQSHSTHDASAYYHQPSSAYSPQPDQHPTSPDQPELMSPFPSSPSASTSDSRPTLQRTPWVMWVGNLPSKTTRDELQRFLTQDPDSGVVSIFVISQSNCAFVNVESESALDRCIARFDGTQLRPDNPRCPRLVCRVRTREDDFKAGVGGQRSSHIHKDAIRNGLVVSKPKASDSTLHTLSSAALALLDQRVNALNLSERPRTPSTNDSTDSTSSSLLAHHFPRRFFILKSFTNSELEESVRTGMWTTQAHNEATLNRAYRTSQEVILFMSENGSGAFYGYARMVSGIGQGFGSTSHPTVSKEKNLTADGIVASTSSESYRAASEPVAERSYLRETPGMRSASSGTPPSEDGTPHGGTPPISTKGKRPKHQPVRMSSEPSGPSRGTPFRVEWISTDRLSFKRTKHITNPWSEGREVKISRDGTELHPTAGKQLLVAWERLANENAHGSGPGSARRRRGISAGRRN